MLKGCEYVFRGFPSLIVTSKTVRGSGRVCDTRRRLFPSLIVTSKTEETDVIKELMHVVEVSIPHSHF